MESITNKHEREEKKLEVALIKWPEELNGTTPNKENIAKCLNKQLPEDQRLYPEDIVDFKDYRGKKGPMLIKLANIKKKVSLLKIRNESVIIKNSPTRDALRLKKIAMHLQKRGKINKFWEYKGFIYISHGREGTREKASMDLFAHIDPGLHSQLPSPSSAKR